MDHGPVVLAQGRVALVEAHPDGPGDQTFQSAGTRRDPAFLVSRVLAAFKVKGRSEQFFRNVFEEFVWGCSASSTGRGVFLLQGIPQFRRAVLLEWCQW